MRAHVDGRRRTLEDIELIDDLGDLRNDLHGGGACADDAHTLAFEIHIVIPAGSVEGLALKGFHTFDFRQFRRSENTVGNDHKASFHFIATVGLHLPSAGRCIPLGFFDRSMKEAFVVKPELLRDKLAVFEDFKAAGKFHGGDIAGLVEQR